MKNHNKEVIIDKLREIEARYKSITETSVDAIITSNQNDIILTWNKGAKLIFGYDDDIINSPVTKLIPDKYKKAHMKGIQRFLKTGEKRIINKKVELQALKSDGSLFDIELSLSSWKSEKDTHFGAIIRDISGRKKMEESRENVQRIMRHDIRSPLVGIAGLAKVMLKYKNLNEKQEKSARLIQELGEKALKFLDRSRDILQIEQGKYPLTRKKLNIVDLIYHLSDELEPLASGKGVTTVIRYDEGYKTKYNLYGDEGLLEIMFGNLIKNAIEASPAGEEMIISVHKERTYRVTVDIYNKGVVPEDIRDVFFEQYATSGKEGGSGIGTYSARLIANTHKGDITFQTSEAEGTHVTVSLPKGK